MIMLFGKQPNVHRCWEMRKKERANARLHQRSLARSHEIKVSIAALSGYPGLLQGLRQIALGRAIRNSSNERLEPRLYSL